MLVQVRIAQTPFGFRNFQTSKRRPKSFGKCRYGSKTDSEDVKVADKWRELVSLLSVDPEVFNAKALFEELKDTTLLGRRGEVWVAAQVVALALIIAPPFNVDVFVRLVGAVGILSGFFIIVTGSSSLGESLSPLPAPRDSNVLVTTGMFQYMRHPLYAGLILGSLGLSIVSESETRLFFTAVLTAVLYQKSKLEEKFMVEKHGNAYEAYCSKVKRFGLF